VKPGPRLGLSLLIAYGVALGGTAEAVGPTLIPRVDEFIDAPRVLFGRTRAEVERVLGVPPYPGVVVRYSPSSALKSVAITTPAYRLPQGLGIGASRSDIEQRLGEPQEMTEVRYLYLYSDGYPDTVEFYFHDGRVRRIEWNYWVESE
jgi:hypothetical protein